MNGATDLRDLNGRTSPPSLGRYWTRPLRHFVNLLNENRLFSNEIGRERLLSSGHDGNTYYKIEKREKYLQVTLQSGQMDRTP